MKPLLPQPGSQIDPRNAVGRTATTQRARRELLAENNLALNDPRRMGKTVWLDLFCADPGEGLTAVKVDYEGVQTSEGLLLRTVSALGSHRGLPSQAMSKIQALFDNVQLSAGPLTIKTGVRTRSPLVLLSDTIQSVDEHLPDGLLLVVAMDEVPMALSNIARNEGPSAAGQMLQALRELRRRRGRMRWIVCGSVGFHHILRRCDATEAEINDLVNLPLGPLELDEASELAERLLLGIQREAGERAVAALAEHSGCIPFLIHALAHRLYNAGSGCVSAADVANAFTDFIEDRDDSRAVTHLLTRLDPLYGEHAPMAEAILDAVAVERRLGVPDLELQDQGLRTKLLNDLVDDHYLVDHAGIVSWRYDVLRKIWVHRRRLA